MSKKKIIAVLSSVIVLLGGGAVVNQQIKTKTQDAVIKTAPVAREDFIKSVGSSGKTKATRSVDLKFQTSGRLAWINVKEGDWVSAYQAIAGLDKREVQETLENTLRDYSLQRNTYEETARVTYQGRFKPTEALDDTMKRLLEKNQWDLESAVADVELDHLAVEYATLITPIAGVVTHVDTPVAGINITPATAVFTVVDPDSMIFEANADEIDVGNLSLGQKASIALDAYPDATFSGTISYISYSSELSAGGATVFPIQIAFDEPQKIRIGLNGDVTIDALRIPLVLTVPLEAIREEEGGKYVFKKNDHSYVKTKVKTGQQNDDKIVIEEGLSEGDSVVIKGFNNLPKS